MVNNEWQINSLGGLSVMNNKAYRQEMDIRIYKSQQIPLNDEYGNLLNARSDWYNRREKQIVASRAIESGELLELGDLICKFTDDLSYFSQRDFLDLRNKKVVKRIEFDEPIKRTHLN